MTDDAYTRAYLALCDAVAAEAPAYDAYLRAVGGTPDELAAAFAVWWPLHETRIAAQDALRALPVPTEEATP